jgi:hypothetical protein
VKRTIAALALLAFATLGAGPAARSGTVPHNAQTAVVQRYLDALHGAHFADAFALLADDERRYFGDAAAFRSVFDADAYALLGANIVSSSGDARGRVYFVRERIGFIDHASDAHHILEATVPLGVLSEHGRLHIKDPGKPYRAFAPSASVTASDLRVTVKKVDFFPNRIDVIATFANVGDEMVTILPYNKSVLRDDRGNVYRTLAIRNWAITDKQLFLGVPLAPNAEYTGSLAFSAPRVDAAKRSWSLVVSPALRAGADAPFDVTIPIVPPS